METQAFHDLIQEASLYNGSATSHSNASSEAGSPFPCQSSSENELSSAEATSTTSFYEDQRKFYYAIAIYTANIYSHSASIYCVHFPHCILTASLTKFCGVKSK